MDNSNPFASLTPTLALQQLRLWLSAHPWFSDQDMQDWFSPPQVALEQLQDDYQKEWTALGLQLLHLQPFQFEDRRFSSPQWASPLFGAPAAIYLLNSKFMLQLVDLLEIDDEKSRQRIRYLIEQQLAASAPSNFLATNPDALERMVATGGASLFSGLLNLASDVQEGKLRQCDAAAFRVGVDLAATAGAVVFENDLLQLIQYRPLTERQYVQPMLIVPPVINKYYILDLRAENSLVRHLLEQGHPVFLISWRNFGQAQADKRWDDLVQDGIISAVRATRAITQGRPLNCMGFCIGGTLLACALAVLAARGDQQVASLTLLATFLDYLDTGPVGVFVDEQLVSYRERTIGGQGGPTGLFRGEDMGNTFSQLRPNELWWNYGVDKYLKGQKPQPLDLLFWNNDSTNLPGPMYCWYLRHTYLQNDLKSATLECCGVRLDLGKITAPAYLLGAIDDHIVPWRSAYASREVLGGDSRFVLTASGHIAGVINPPARQKRHYWVNPASGLPAQAWQDGASQQPGSWWNDWFTWLASRSGEQVAAITQLGSAEYPPLEDAPGRYVHE